MPSLVKVALDWSFLVYLFATRWVRKLMSSLSFFLLPYFPYHNQGMVCGQRDQQVWIDATQDRPADDYGRIGSITEDITSFHCWLAIGLSWCVSHIFHGTTKEYCWFTVTTLFPLTWSPRAFSLFPLGHLATWYWILNVVVICVITYARRSYLTRKTWHFMWPVWVLLWITSIPWKFCIVMSSLKTSF